MKKLLLLTILVFTGSIAMGAQPNHQYKITVTNVTKGQPLTPAVVAVHSASFKMFKLGEEASEGLKRLAEDGVTTDLVKELKGHPAVKATATGSGVVLPGQSTEILVNSAKVGYISLATMLARTNDAFAAGRFLRVPAKKGHKVAYHLSVYDAGSEINSESCADIPAPPCDSHNVGPDGEGFVHSHPGVYGIADLQVLRDSFGKAAAKVVIEKL